jgi:predicted nucleotidyltransferase
MNPEKSLNNTPTITPEKVELAIQALVKTFDPIKIYAFGSYARGTFDEESDLDIMVLVESYNDKKPIAAIYSGYESLKEIHMPVDLLVYDRKKHDELKNDSTSFCYQIINKGKLLYEKR